MSAERPIVISDGEDGSDAEPHPVQVGDSPVKVVPTVLHRNLVRSLESEFEKSDCDSDDESIPTTTKRMSFGDDPADSCTPVYETPSPKYSAEELLKILLKQDIPSSKICTMRPIAISCSATYVIDVTKLHHPDDVEKDAFGKWEHFGSHNTLFKTWSNAFGEVEVEKCAPGASGQNVFHLRRLYSRHPSNPDCRRILVFVTDNSGNPHHLCMAIYHIPSGFSPIVSSHGNSKTMKPFHPTWPSTKQHIKQECKRRGLKETVSVVSSKAGGSLGARTPGELPRNEQQVSYLKRTGKTKCAALSGSDELFTVMQRCKEEDQSNRFIRDVRAAPEPAMVLATDAQLLDMVKFCTREGEFCVLTIDPTFNLGDFDVTPVTYHHLLLESHRSQKPPVFIGPLFIHYRKTFQTYLYFASTLVGLQPELVNVRAFGTDGEKPLASAFMHEFHNAVHLNCSIHLRRNVKKKLQDMSFSTSDISNILNEIFGNQIGSVYYEGLVDATSTEDFDEKLSGLKGIWHERNAELGDSFHEWFVKEKATTFKTSAIRPAREAAGLGSPPDQFTTNVSETVNFIMKSKVDYKNELPQFIEKMQSLIHEQQEEIQRAVYGRGKWKFRTEFKYLELTEAEWFAMLPKERRRYMETWVQNTFLEDGQTMAVIPVTPSLESSSHDTEPRPTSSGSRCLSIDVKSFAQGLTVPLASLEGIWKKAQELLSSSDNLTLAPGHGSEARMVRSTTGKRPHLVKPGKGGRFLCDSECLNYKALGICSHVVATAEANNKLIEFSVYYRKSKKTPNFTDMAKSDMPSGRGQKGSVPPRKRKKAEPIDSRVPLAATRGSSSATDSIETSGSQSAGPSSVFSNITVGPSSSSNLTYYQNSSFLSPISSSQLQTSPGFGFMPTPPTPGFSPQMCSSVPTSHPFKLCFLTGNISVCNGCLRKYPKPPAPPYDIVIQHEEWRSFLSGGVPQTRFGNAYYHATPACVQARWPMFQPYHLQIPEEVFEALNDEHKWLIANNFELIL